MIPNFLQPNCQSRPHKEGAESEHFWGLLGGKVEYPSQKISRNNESDPHLFSCTFAKGVDNCISILRCTSLLLVSSFIYKSNFVLGIDFAAEMVASCRRFEGIPFLFSSCNLL